MRSFPDSWDGGCFYDSQYESWSKYITGTAGVKPTYDVLGFLVEEAHKRNIQFHAWLNPYRISTRANKGSSFPQLDPKIPVELTKDYEKSGFIIQLYRKYRPELHKSLKRLLLNMMLTVSIWTIIFIPH